MYKASKTKAYRQDFNENKYITFLIKDDQFLEKRNKIWDKFGNTIKREFDTKYNEKYLKSNIKSYERKIKLNMFR